MQRKAAFHPGLHFLLRLKQSWGAEIHHNLENTTCDPLKFKMGSPILIVSFFRIESANNQTFYLLIRFWEFAETQRYVHLQLSISTQQEIK